MSGARSVIELAAMFDLTDHAREEMVNALLDRLDAAWTGRTETVEREVLCFMQGWVDCRALLESRLFGAKDTPVANVVSEDALSRENQSAGDST